MFEVLDGAEKRRVFLPVFLMFFILLLMSWSAALQLSTRWAAALYSQAGSSAAAFASLYAILLFPLPCIMFRTNGRHFFIRCSCSKKRKGVLSDENNHFLYLLVFIGFICYILCVVAPLAVLLGVRPVSGSDYLSIISTDFSMRNSICYLNLVYSNKHDSVVGLLQRIGL
jgi:hypothetical protein